ncbi:TonB-dependent receptor [Massilia yuzhufengensis]|uniref:TonB-dependent receptor n=1 Tax=Massilia yuzhufengensis TaxID=1164594 RepID=A0A1I1UM04_9BURK|nr:TonB-dependent receptor [Massilia yuzhufengensis]SFD71605.1 TonB-dependent receptor [Massilia yuzhufengensis]
MTTLKVRPVCAAVLLLCAHSGSAAAQESTQATLDPAAQPAAGEIATVQVTGIRSSIRSAEQIKRDAEQVVDSINADDIGKFPDRAAGDALQRIAGVQVGRDRGETNTVIIRGLPDVATTIDGNEIFTGTGRRLSYQDLPVQSIAGLDVYKSATANQFEGGIAGAVNIRLRAPFDFKGYTVTGFLENRRTEVEGSSASKAKNNPGGGLLLSNRWQTGVGEMGVLVDLAYNKDHWAFPVQWVDRPDRIFSVSPDGTAIRLNDDQPIAPLRAGDRLGELPNIGGIYNAGDRERGSMHAAFQWKISPALELTTQYLGTGYRGESEVDYILNIATWTPRLTNVVMAPVGDYCNTPNGVICPIQSANAAAARFNGPYDWDPYTATSTWGVKERTDTHFLNFGLKYREGPLSLDTNLAFNRSDFINDTVIVDQQIPGASSSVYTYGRDGHGGYNSVTTPTSSAALRDPNQFVLRGMVQNWGESRGEQAQFRSDAVYRVGDGFITALTGGLRLSTRDVSFHSGERANDLPNTTLRATPVGAFGPSFQTLVPGLDRLGGPWYTPSREFLIHQADTVRAFYGQPAGRVADDPMRLFEQRERTATLHLGARWKAALGSIGMTGNVGGRLVKVDRQLQGNQRVGNVVTPIDEDSDETNFLPNVSAVVNWTDRLQSHLSVGKTLTRPEFSQLNPALSLIPPTVNAPGTGSAGNPNLAPTKSVNSDATLEYYFKDNGFAQVALFHRDIDGYLQNFEQDETINGVTYRVNRPQNSGKGKLKGAEFGIQKFFDFLPGVWSGLGAQFNYTWIDGENQTRTSLNSGAFTSTRMVGVARQSYNFALLYERGSWTGRLAATRRGKYVEQIAEPRFGQDRIVAASTYVDLSIGYALTPHLSLNFDAINLTRERYESYLGDPIRPRDIRYTPTTYGLSLRYQM